jgi:hypothetical protein
MAMHVSIFGLDGSSESLRFVVLGFVAGICRDDAAQR